MGKLATTVDEQILLLEARGMILDLSKDKVKEILMDIGYYRLGFYWHPFEKNKAHEFEENTKFSDVVALYYLDVDLRHLLLKYLNRFEIHFRTQVIYIVSNYYKQSPTWFADSHIMQNSFIYNLKNNYYTEQFINQNKAIKKHHEKHINDRFAPAWKTLEFLPFGSILAIFRALKNKKCQESISNQYGVRNVQIFKDYIKTLLTLRNICAHGGQLYDFKTPKGIPKIPKLNLLDNDRHSLNGVFKLLYFMLDSISSSRKNELKQYITELLTENASNDKLKHIIETKIGYKFV
jgi:abortive infection bacteriophage resistance protein